MREGLDPVVELLDPDLHVRSCVLLGLEHFVELTQLSVEPCLSRTYYFIEVGEWRRGFGVEGDCSIGRGGTGVGRRGQRQGAR